MEDLIYELNDVHFSYLGKFPALCGITINIRPGEKIAIIGANGSGKSTLLHMLDGLIFPSKGVVKTFGNELNEEVFRDEHFSRCFRRKVGLVFQNADVQLFCPTVKEDIIFGPLHLGVEEKKINERLNELVALLGIQHLLDRSPHQLSVGEKRKVAIASTLAIDPEVLLLDEPTAGLDPLTIRHIMDFFMQATVAHKTIIIATHDLHFIEEISDIIYVFSPEKNIVRRGEALEILHDTALLETNNLIHAHAHRHKGAIHIHPHEHLHHNHEK
jgi:ABC-type cobalt transport system, ATPase component